MAAPMAQRNVIRFSQIIRNTACTSCSQELPFYSVNRQFQRLHYGVRYQTPTPMAFATKPIVLSFCPHYSSAKFKQHCWKCETEIDPERDQYFCECGLIQPPVEERTYFGVVEVEEEFDIDTKEMTKKFRARQSQLHPDKFAQKSEVKN